MEARIVGLRGAGKTTLLEALSEGKLGSGIATVHVSDSRVRVLSDIFKPKKTTFAEFHVREPEWPRGSGRKGEMESYLDDLQGANVYLHVLRTFDNPMLGTSVDVARDLRELDHAFVLSDMLAIERSLERARKQPLADRDRKTLERCQAALEEETPLGEMELDDGEEAFVKGFGFRTKVAQVLVVNVESGATFDADSLGEAARGRRVVAFPFPDAKEVAELSPEEQLTFAEALGLPGTASEVVTRAVFDEMGLISFFTVGEDEVRAWPLRRGAFAQAAAGVIHSDLARGFIRAETVGYETFITHQTLKGCRDAGALRLEGKEYVVEDGDIINVRFNV